MTPNVPHKGARITELSITDLREIYEARLSVEPLAIARAAQLTSGPLFTPPKGGELPPLVLALSKA